VSNVLKETKKQQVLALGRLGWTQRRIERETGVRRETVGRYLRAAGIDTYPASEEQAESSKPATPVPPDSKPAPEVTPDPTPATASACQPFHEVIAAGLARGRNAKAIWQELVDLHGFPASYQSVKRFVHQQQSTTPEPRVVILTEPGEEGQVDYGEGPMVRDPLSGKYRRTRLFVFTLGYSRKCVRLLTFHSSARIWPELHEQTFRRLGGVPKVVVQDNLREGILKPDFYDPALNPLYRDMLAHYGAVALPCRVRDPDRKGKVESGVAHAQKTPLKGQRFESLEDAQQYLDQWEQRWADTRIHGTTKRQVAAMFAQERPTLLPLPLEPFRYYLYGQRTVHLDGCVEVEAAYYSTPLGWIGRCVQAQWDERCVRLLDPLTGTLLREHPRQPRGAHRILPQDQPAQTPLGTQQLLRRAQQAGPHIGALCQAMHHHHQQLAVRRIQGVLALTKKHGLAAVEQACGLALEWGIAEYRFVRRYLERQLPLPLTLRQLDPLIRQLSAYRQVIETRTSSSAPENPSV
jgi:transposase